MSVFPGAPIAHNTVHLKILTFFLYGSDSVHDRQSLLSGSVVKRKHVQLAGPEAEVWPRCVISDPVSFLYFCSAVIPFTTRVVTVMDT